MSSKQNVEVIRANPGWDLVLPITQGRKVIGVFYRPIIAWAIRTGFAVSDDGPLLHFTIPVTVEGNTGYETEIIRDPKGQLEETGNMSFCDEQDVIERLQAISDRWTALEEKAASNQTKGRKS
jgi:hypothetical protein